MQKCSEVPCRYNMERETHIDRKEAMSKGYRKRINQEWRVSKTESRGDCRLWNEIILSFGITWERLLVSHKRRETVTEKSKLPLGACNRSDGNMSCSSKDNITARRAGGRESHKRITRSVVSIGNPFRPHCLHNEWPILIEEDDNNLTEAMLWHT